MSKLQVLAQTVPQAGNRIQAAHISSGNHQRCRTTEPRGLRGQTVTRRYDIWMFVVDKRRTRNVTTCTITFLRDYSMLHTVPEALARLRGGGNIASNTTAICSLQNTERWAAGLRSASNCCHCPAKLLSIDHGLQSDCRSRSTANCTCRTAAAFTQLPNRAVPCGQSVFSCMIQKESGKGMSESFETALTHPLSADSARQRTHRLSAMQTLPEGWKGR